MHDDIEYRLLLLEHNYIFLSLIFGIQKSQWIPINLNRVA